MRVRMVENGVGGPSPATWTGGGFDNSPIVCVAHGLGTCAACDDLVTQRLALVRAARRDPRELQDGCEDLRGEGHIESLGHPQGVERALAWRENAARPVPPRIPSPFDRETCSALTNGGTRCRTSPTRQARWMLDRAHAKGLVLDVEPPLCSSHLDSAIKRAQAAQGIHVFHHAGCRTRLRTT